MTVSVTVPTAPGLERRCTEPCPIRDLAPHQVLGGGRDRRFGLPQFGVDIAGLETAFFDAGAGTPVVFVHGLAGNLTHWVHVAPHVAGRARAIGIDLWGCGESAKPTDGYGIAAYVDQVLGLLDRLGIEAALLVAHSLGGIVSTQLALTRPERVRGLVLVNPAGFNRMGWLVRMGGKLLLREPILKAVLPRAWQWILDHVFEADNEHTRAFVRMCDETYDPATELGPMARVMASLRKELVELNFVHALDRLRLPIHLVWGAQDRLIPGRVFREAAARLAHVTIDEIPRCGHMPIIEQPHRVLAAIHRALDQLGSPGPTPSPAG
jgi:pimeloyl-ACP methyl ester carboxylesterase